MLHVFRPQGIAARSQGGGDHQRIEKREAVPFAEADRRFMGIDIDRGNGRADRANGGQVIADLLP